MLGLIRSVVQLFKLYNSVPTISGREGFFNLIISSSPLNELSYSKMKFPHSSQRRWIALESVEFKSIFGMVSKVK